MKQCSKCNEKKELTEFNKNKSRKDGLQHICRICDNEKTLKYGRDVMGYLPMSENKECPCYLGVAVAERLVKHLFKDVVGMPHGNPGYDFICAKNKKIDVKSACSTPNHNIKNMYWKFTIDHNKIADYFLLLAFNNIIDLEPLHQWLIPGNVLNHLTGTTISPATINRWDEYKQPIGPAITCCNTLKEF